MIEKHTNEVTEISPEKKQRVKQVVEMMVASAPSDTDPNGSYTGKPAVKGEVPVQDADDL